MSMFLSLQTIIMFKIKKKLLECRFQILMKCEWSYGLCNSCSFLSFARFSAFDDDSPVYLIFNCHSYESQGPPNLHFQIDLWCPFVYMLPRLSLCTMWTIPFPFHTLISHQRRIRLLLHKLSYAFRIVLPRSRRCLNVLY